jgi:hypothetical protein
VSGYEEIEFIVEFVKFMTCFVEGCVFYDVVMNDFEVHRFAAVFDG